MPGEGDEIELPHTTDVHARLAAIERLLGQLRAEVSGEDRVTTLRLDVLDADVRALRAEIVAQEAELRQELAKKVPRERYDIFERALLAFIGVTMLTVLGAVLAQVLIQPSGSLP